MSSEEPIQSRPDVSNEAWETTAQWAKAEASTLELSNEVERNARKEAEVVKQAADAALHFSPRTTDKTSQTFDNLERDASLRTQEAVDEGRRDVQEAVAIGSSYLGAAIDTVKSYLPSSITDASSAGSDPEKK
ncbi:hypothetical protein BDM02DRAFT_3115252 [Thelephora ganbajun]|uniref:Uncharacterized protein n=1 Tax=Thelephora ganbajun TaxID=370292 RepID=A0ACB6ZGH9_THEGA|nr:hypothetical protein BDM02DRAFT_3115252 [Thelephora ganbajun]